MHQAAPFGDSSLIRLLHNASTDINGAATPLEIAVRRNTQEAAESRRQFEAKPGKS